MKRKNKVSFCLAQSYYEVCDNWKMCEIDEKLLNVQRGEDFCRAKKVKMNI